MILGVIILVILEMYFLEYITKKKIKNFLTIAMFIILIVIMGANTQNPDTTIYEEYIFNKNEFFSKDFGFGILVSIFKKMNLDYYALKMFVSVVGFILINHTLKKYVEDYKPFFVLYIIYPYFFDVVQVRNFLAMSIFIYSIPYLLEDTKKGNIKYFVLVLLAATIQKTALIYLPILFVRKINNQKYSKKLFGVIIVISILISIYRPLLNSFISFLINNVSGYLEGLGTKLSIQTNFGWIVQWGIQFTNYYFINAGRNIIYKFSSEDSSISDKTNKMKKYSTLILNINYYMFLFLPLYILTPTFARIMRNVLVLNYVVYVFVIELVAHEKMEENKRKYRTYILMIFIAQIIFYIGQYIYSQSGYFSEIVYPILTENWIFKCLGG